MADEIDDGNATAELYLAGALQSTLQRPTRISTGVCGCGTLIEPARLRTLPHAQNCALCAAEAAEEAARVKRTGVR